MIRSPGTHLAHLCVIGAAPFSYPRISLTMAVIAGYRLARYAGVS
jgi:hypothetical protein